MMRQRTPTAHTDPPGLSLPLKNPCGYEGSSSPSNGGGPGRTRKRRVRRKKRGGSSLQLLVPIGALFLLVWFFSKSLPTTTSRWGSLFQKSSKDGPPADLIVHGKRDHYTPCPDLYKKRAWADFYEDTHIPRAIRSQGWYVSVEPEDKMSEKFQILYKPNIKEMSLFKQGQPYQRFGRIPSAFIFAQKDSFFEGFRTLQRTYEEQLHKEDPSATPQDLMYFIPESYRLDEAEDREIFTKTINHDRETGRLRPWVLKKAKLNNGDGIEMLPPNSPALYSAVERSQDDEQNKYIVQSYICNELTWFGGKKFDLRFYWFVASIDPLIVLYHDGYARVAGALYNETDWGSTGQHLTNHAFRVEMEKPVDEDVLADALWRRLRQHYQQDKARLSKLIPGGDPVRHVRNQIKEAISTTVEAFKSTFESAQNKTTMENLFAFYGADFVIDADLDIYYLEAQTGPGLGMDYDYRIELFRSLFRPMVNLVEEIALKQEADAKANLLPLESIADYELVYAGDWRYRYEGYERTKDKKGCQLSPSALQKVA